jgi:hypothetical protein
VTIRISDGRLLGQLIEALQRAGCAAARVGDDRCRVSTVAADESQAYLELRFFARAWALGHDADVQIEV